MTRAKQGQANPASATGAAPIGPWHCRAALPIALLATIACDGGSSTGAPDGAVSSIDAMTPGMGPVPDGDLTVPGPGYTAPGALVFRVVHGSTGAAVPATAFWQALAGARVVCLGETHDDYFSHSLQYLVARTLGAGRPEGLTIAFEPFEANFQTVVDEFATGQIDEAQLLERSQYQMRWGFDWQLYRPLVLLAPQRRHALLAVNPAQEITRKVSERGLASLTPAEQAQLPQLDLTDTAHREWFRAQITDGHGNLTQERFENLYASQVIRDETMADLIVRRLAQPGAERVVGVIGHGHCMRHGIPMRAERRGATGIVTVRTVDPFPEFVDEAVAERLFDFVVAPGS